MNKAGPSLFFLQCSLVSLFAVTQWLFFAIHYKVSDLIDSLSRSAIAPSLFEPVILFPVLGLLALQILLLGLTFLYIWYIPLPISKWLALSDRSHYFLSLLVLILGFSFIISANAYFFPLSFFAPFFNSISPKVNQVIFFSTSFLLCMLTAVALVSGYRLKKYLFITHLFLFILLSALLIQGYNYFLLSQKKTPSFLKPNVIIIGLDSLRPDYLSYFNPRALKTPTIDRLLQQSLVFTDSYSPLARTFPSWMGLLTGNHPRHTAIRGNLAKPDVVLKQANLAKTLKAQGYQTWYGSDEVRFTDISKDYGFDHLIGPKGGAAEFIVGSLSDFPLLNLLLKTPFARFLLPFNYANRGLEITYYPEDFLHLMGLSLAKLENKPLFLALHLCLAHWPHRFANDHQPSDLKMAERYALTVVDLDKQLAQVLKRLKQKGILDNALLVLVSDHGVSIGLDRDRLSLMENYRGDKRKIYLLKKYLSGDASSNSIGPLGFSIETSYGQGTDVLSIRQNQILMAMKGFNFPLPVKQVDMRVSLMDIAPTLLALLKISPLPHTDGISLVPYLSGTKKVDRPLFLETGDTVGSIETDKIVIEKVVKETINAFRLDLTTGNLVLTEAALKSLIRNKQRAVLWKDWFLAYYPAHVGLGFKKAKNHGFFSTTYFPPYYVLVNLKTLAWTIEATGPLIHEAPLATLKALLQQFYGEEFL